MAASDDKKNLSTTGSFDSISLVYPFSKDYAYLTNGPTGNQCFGTPRSNKSGKHAGMDIGTTGHAYPFVAVADGTVKEVGYTAARGGYIVLEHGGGVLYTLYEHMNSKSSLQVGQEVKQSQVIGYVGSAGTTSTGYHLHFGMFTKWYGTVSSDITGMINGTTLNPEKYLSRANAEHSTTWNPDSSLFTDTAALTKESTSKYTAEGDSETSEEHQTETIRAWSSYLDDNVRKSTDEYKLVWRGYQQIAYDISGRIADLTLTDSIDEVCTELDFTVVRSDDDYYLKRLNDFTVGDEISLSNVNTNETIFVGTVQQISGDLGRAVSVVCLDKGTIMTKNEFLVQFHSASGEDVVATMASKAGLKKYNCPKFTSTNEQTYETSASEIVQDMLDTIKTENGITYFMRVVDDCLVIRSRAKTAITPYHKPNSNVEAFPCVMGMSRPSYNYSITNMYNSVQVYQSEDSSKEVVGEASSEDGIAHYGKMNKLVEYSGKDPATGDKKAEYELNYVYNLIENTLSFECPGSDRIIAGVRIKVPINDELKEYWVHEVEHTYIPTHTCNLTLVECDQEEPVYEGPDVDDSVEEDEDSGTSASGTATDYDWEGLAMTEEQWQVVLEEQQRKADEEEAKYG